MVWLGGKKNCARPISLEIQARMFSRSLTRPVKGRSASDMMNLEGDEVETMVRWIQGAGGRWNRVAATNVGEMAPQWNERSRKRNALSII